MTLNSPFSLMRLRQSNVDQDQSQKTYISQPFLPTIHAFPHTEFVFVLLDVMCVTLSSDYTHLSVICTYSYTHVSSFHFVTIIHDSCVIRILCAYVGYSYPYTLLIWVFPYEEFFLPFSGFLLSMGFSPGLCRATTDLNQLLYVW